MSDTLREGIIATVVGGLILALILWLLGLLAPTGRWLRGLPPRIWGIFTKRRPHGRHSVLPEVPPSKPVPIDVDPELDQLQARIMRFFAEADGGRFNVVEMSYKITVPKLRIEAALDGLTRHGLVAPNRNYVDGTTYGLTSNGRDFLIRKGTV